MYFFFFTIIKNIIEIVSFFFNPFFFQKDIILTRPVQIINHNKKKICDKQGNKEKVSFKITYIYHIIILRIMIFLVYIDV